LECRERLEWLD